ncbi:hypothetical protein KM043_000276 [Ampulex compressa]|nr:hypothetical protein KM043_000276 [Ampulex compressa]
MFRPKGTRSIGALLLARASRRSERSRRGLSMVARSSSVGGQPKLAKSVGGPLGPRSSVRRRVLGGWAEGASPRLRPSLVRREEGRDGGTRTRGRQVDARRARRLATPLEARKVFSRKPEALEGENPGKSAVAMIIDPRRVPTPRRKVPF